jgi:quinoprotein glucose dehydrogenase
MYIITPLSNVVALNATTGEKIWRFCPDPPLNMRELGGGGLASRGVAFWEGGERKRIFVPVRDGRLISLDAETGTPDREFGNQGVVDLRERLVPGGRKIFLSSPPAICGEVVIQGFGMPDSYSRLEHVPVAAVNARNGEILWTFNVIPQNGEAGSETWENGSGQGRGGGNIWSIMSVDEARQWVFLPATAPNFDFYGGDRKGNNLYCNSVIALDAGTGEYVWHYQTVHHDLWDYDLPAQPNLIELTIDGRKVPAVAQVGKTGFVYLLHRETGKPIFPIEEKPVPCSDVPGESASPTQPMPSRPPAFTTQGLTEENLSRIDEETYEYLKQELRKYRSAGIFTPPSEQGSVVFPGFHGGANWSGAAVDADGMMYVNSTELACIVQLLPTPGEPFAYKHTGWIRFRDQKGYPANSPPWGQLSKIDLNRGEIVWQVPLGEFEELSRRGIPPTGQENFGGATVTAGGLVFIASTMDEYFRAFATENGAVLWKEKLPVAGYAAPITYLGSDGRQYVAIFAGGGGKLATPAGDYVMAFALPEE